MPSGKDWIGLLRTTFHDVGRADISGLYSLEWKRAKAKLTADDRGRIDSEPKRLRRFLKTANGILFGLSRRLAPARRVVFLLVLACLALSINGPSFSRDTSTEKGRETHTVEYHFYFDNGLLLASSLLLGLLLAMELVDKINYRDELELARDLQASLIPRQLPRTAPSSSAPTTRSRTRSAATSTISCRFRTAGWRCCSEMRPGMAWRRDSSWRWRTPRFARSSTWTPPRPPCSRLSTGSSARRAAPRAFFSCVYLLAAPDGTFSGSFAGHPPILQIDRQAAVKARIGKGAYPLGIRPSLSWPVETGRIEPGETLFLYSDGLSEARNDSGLEYGEGRIEAAVLRSAGTPAPAVAAEVAADMHRFLGGPLAEDDVSVAVVRRRA